MGSTTPLSYDGLKAVLQYMDANQRFEISQHCPTIRKVERILPLKIDKFHIKEHAIAVNQINYNLTTYRKYPEGVPIPLHHKNQNGYHGYTVELDQYGARQKNLTLDLQPGDIFVENLRERYDVTDDREIATYLERIEETKRNIKLKAEGKATLGSALKTAEKLADELQWYYDRLQPLLNRRDNVLPLYKVMIKLEKTRNGSVKIELFKNTRKIHEALKKIITFMLDRRPNLILVKNLVIDDHLEALRLPVGLKFKIQELDAPRNLFRRIPHILDEASFPLKAIRLRQAIYNVEQLDHPWEQSAQKLILEPDYFHRNWLYLVPKIPHKEICLVENRMESDFLEQMLFFIINRWTGTNRCIGSRISFEKIRRERRTVMDTLGVLREEFNGIWIHETLLMIPLNAYSKFEIAFEIDTTNIVEGVEMHGEEEVNVLIKITVLHN